jgi:hypothetical protein
MSAPRYFVNHQASDPRFLFAKIDYRTFHVFKDGWFQMPYSLDDYLSNKDWEEVPIEEIALKFGIT